MILIVCSVVNEKFPIFADFSQTHRLESYNYLYLYKMHKRLPIAFNLDSHFRGNDSLDAGDYLRDE